MQKKLLTLLPNSEEMTLDMLIGEQRDLVSGLN